MSNVAYEISGDLTAQEVCDLTVAVGWNNPAKAGMDLLQRVWDEAACKVTARADDGRLVGMCRAYWDGGFTATIVSVIVHPDLQGQGIGRQMVALLEACEMDRAGRFAGGAGLHAGRRPAAGAVAGVSFSRRR